MNSHKNNIGMIYCKNGFDIPEIVEIENELSKYGVKLISYERATHINASIDFFMPFLQIILSPEMVMAISQGVLTNSAYEGIKVLLQHIYSKFHTKKVLKLQSGKANEEPANIHFIMGNNHLILPVNVDKERFEYAVDKFMVLSATSEPTEKTYTFFSEKDDTILSKTENEIIQEEYEKQKAKNNLET